MRLLAMNFINKRTIIRELWYVGVSTSLLISMLGCRTPSANWNGVWKLNPVKGSFRGPTFVVSTATGGEYRYSDGRSSFTFRCDGHDQTIGQSRTQACVRYSAVALDLIRKQNGKVTNLYHWELSSNANVLTLTSTEIRPNGPVVTLQVVSSRISGANDFTGLWLDESFLQRHADMVLKIDKQAVHISYPDAGQDIYAPFNGVYAVVQGIHAPAGLTYTAQLLGRHEIVTLAKRNDKVLTQDFLKLSADGRMITESWLNPDQPSGKATFVYEKRN